MSYFKKLPFSILLKNMKHKKPIQSLECFHQNMSTYFYYIVLKTTGLNAYFQIPIVYNPC